MIDWITCIVPLAHNPIPSGAFLSISHDGEIEYSCVKKFSLRGSFDSKIQVRSDGALTKDGLATLLFVDGNPSKFLQGHNIFGINDAHLLFRKFISKICSLLGFPEPIIDFELVKISRIDICESFSFRTRLEAHQYIRQVAMASSGRIGRPTMTGHTCYFGKNSRRWSIKYYSKGDELSKNKLPPDLPFRDQLIVEADTLVRCELTLRSLDLRKKELNLLSAWIQDKLYSVYDEYLKKIRVSSQMKIENEVLSSLPRCYRDTYFRWKAGIDVRLHMSKATFYKHRNYLLSFGVDISIPCPDAIISTAEIIPIYQIIEPKPYTIPRWAYGTQVLVS